MIRPRAPQEAAAGLFLLALAGFGLWQTAELTTGTLRQLGPGMMPRLLSILTGLCGLALLVLAFLKPGNPLERWSLRGPLFILGAVVVFGLTIRPLGFLVAGPLAVLLGGLASAETRFRELVIFAAVMTGFCFLLFKVLLTLPIPVAPFLLGY